MILYDQNYISLLSLPALRRAKQGRSRCYEGIPRPRDLVHCLAISGRRPRDNGSINMRAGDNVDTIETPPLWLWQRRDRLCRCCC